MAGFPLSNGPSVASRAARLPLLAPRAGAAAAARRVMEAGRPAAFAAADGEATLGVVLGTGLGGLSDRLHEPWALPAADTGWLVPSTATGHAGRIVCGTLGGRGGCRVVMLQGRVHGYEGHAPERLARGVELLAALGATTLLITNAAGGLRPDMRTGELVVVDDHIDLVRGAWGDGLEPAAGVPMESGFAQGGAAAAHYDRTLVTAALEATRRAGVVARAGVYAHLKGPSYETRAEYRMLRMFGADVVGMSTVPEVVVARRLGLRVAAVSVVTNVACPDAPACTDAEDVCTAAAAAAAGVWAILEAVAGTVGPAVRKDIR